MTDQGTGMVVYDSQLLSSARAVGVDLVPLLRQVPEANEDAQVDIIRQLLEAKDAGDLNAPFSMEGLQEWEGQPVRIDSIRQMPSDYEGGLGVYLICEVTEPRSGARKTVSTGSTTIIVQLVKAHIAGWLPLLVVPRFAKKPTAAGFTPMHLEIVAG